MKIYIDIETIPCQLLGIKAQIASEIKPPANISKAETIAKWEEESKPDAVELAWRKTSFDGGYGQIVCASIAINDDAPIVFYDTQWLGAEALILVNLFEALAKPMRTLNPTFIGHYHADFDMRFIYHRAVINGIKPPPNMPFNVRPWDSKVFDTMYQWAGHGNRISLDNLCRILGIEGKGGLDGSKVWDYVQTGRIDKVAMYCMADVHRVREVYKRMTFEV